MSEPVLITEKKGNILYVTLNRPGQKNAVDVEMICKLADAWTMLDEDNDIRVAVLTGAGGNFCSGMDLKSINRVTAGAAPENEFEERVQGDFNTIFKAWLKNPLPEKPVIAAIEGYALAGGTELVLGTDIRVAGKSANFGIPEVQRALVPLSGAQVRMPKQIPYTIALQLLLTGEHITAEKAEKIGLIGSVVSDGDALKAATEIAEQIAGNGPMAVKAILKTVRETRFLPEAEGLDIEMNNGLPVMMSKDAKEGTRAFIEKRKPEYKGE